MGKERPQIKILKHMRLKKQAEWSGIHAGNIHLFENFSLQRRKMICRNWVTREASLPEYDWFFLHSTWSNRQADFSIFFQNEVTKNLKALNNFAYILMPTFSLIKLFLSD